MEAMMITKIDYRFLHLLLKTVPILAVIISPTVAQNISSSLSGQPVKNTSVLEQRIVRIGHLYSPTENRVYNLVTLELAERRLRRLGVIGSNIQFQYHFATVDSASRYEQAKGLDLFFYEDVDVIIGPPFTRAMPTLAQLAVYWDLPMFSYFAVGSDLSNKSTYQTLVRSAPTLDQLGKALLMSFRYLKWRKIAYVYKSGGTATCDTLASQILAYLRSPEATSYYAVNIVRLDIIDESVVGLKLAARINETLLQIQRSARIVFVCFNNDPGHPENRKFMIAARNLGMTNGEYVFLLCNSFKSTINRTDPWIGSPWDGMDEIAKEAYRAALLFELAGNDQAALAYADNLIKRQATRAPYNQSTDPTVDFYFANTLRGFLYASMYLYGEAFNVCTTVSGPEAYKSGRLMYDCSRLISFTGLAKEPVYIGETADRLGAYLLESFAENGTLVKHLEIEGAHPCMDKELDNGTSGSAAFTLETISLDADDDEHHGRDSENSSEAPSITYRICPERFTVVNELTWPTPDGKMPPDEPPCGFTGDACADRQKATKIVVASVIGTLVFIAFLGCLLYRRARRSRNGDILSLQWQIDRKDLQPVAKRQSKNSGSLQSQVHSLKSASTHSPVDDAAEASSLPSVGRSSSSTSEAKSHAAHAIYQGSAVSLESFHKNRNTVQFRLQHLTTLKQILEIHHENLNKFYGVCLDELPDMLFVWHYPPKGHIKSVIHNHEFELDFAFKSAILRDIITGLEYLHTRSPLGYHGHLRSSNCVVTSRWVVQLSGFGLPQLLGDFFADGSLSKGDLQQCDSFWKQQDMADFAALMYEVITRNRPPAEPGPALGPAEKQNQQIVNLFQQCNAPAVTTRPTAATAKVVVFKNSYGEKNLVDHMVGMMEKYASKLELLVSERTTLLQEERLRADQLLYQLLPRSIADSLKQGLPVIPELYESASIFYSDIVGFTTISSASTPLQIVQMLNLLYQQFDAIIALHDCYKVETIGDAYLVVSGVPNRNGDKHVTEIANMALGILKHATQEFKIPHMPTRQLLIRVGLHTGPLAAGVIGLSMPKYCIFGDSVNIAARMESSGEAGRIQISWATHALLLNTHEFLMTIRGQISHQERDGVLFDTFWLHGLSKQGTSTSAA